MKVKEITLDIEDDYILLPGSGILMYVGTCPYCGAYNIDNFVPERLEKDKTEYVCKCEECGRKARVVIPPRLGTPKETINKIVEHLRKKRLRIRASVEAGDGQEILDEFDK